MSNDSDRVRYRPPSDPTSPSQVKRRSRVLRRILAADKNPAKTPVASASEALSNGKPHLNLMSKPKGVVEEALDSLQSSLSNDSNVEFVPYDGSLAQASVVRSREELVSGGRTKTRPERRKTDCMRKSQSHGSKRVSHGKSRKSAVKARRIRPSEMKILLHHVNKRVERLERFGSNQETLRRLLEETKDAHRMKKDAKAIETLAKLRKETSLQEIQILRDVLSDAQARFVAARKAGVNIGPSVRLLMEAKQHLKKCNLERAVELARQAGASVEELLVAFKEAEGLMTAAARAVALAESTGTAIPEARHMMADIEDRIEKGDYGSSIAASRHLLTMARERTQQRARECVDLAERSLELAKEAEGEIGSAGESLQKSKQHLDKMELAQSIKLANASMLESNAATFSVMKERTGRIGEFAKGVSGEIESLNQVQEAIVHSRERNLEMIRKYAYLTEEIVSQAYDTASSYSRVSQDIVKQAYNSSIEVDPTAAEAEGAAPNITASAIGRALSASTEDRRLRIIDMFLSGKINESQLERLLVLLDASIPKVELAEVVTQSDISRT